MLSLKMRGSGDEILIRDLVEMNKDITPAGPASVIQLQ